MILICKECLLFMKLCVYVYNFLKCIIVYSYIYIYVTYSIQQEQYVSLTEQVDGHPNILTFYADDEYVYKFVETNGDKDC